MSETSDEARALTSKITLRSLNGGIRDFTLLAMPPKSPLFRYPDDGNCETLDEFIAAVNTLVVAHALRASSVRPPQSLEGAVTANGLISEHTEVLFFGRWLLINGKPGYRPVRGQPADEVVVFRTVAAMVAEILSRQRVTAHAMTHSAIVPSQSPSTNNTITRTDLRNRWKQMYGDCPDASAFKSRIKTAQRYMRNYLDVLQRTDGAFGRPGPLDSERLGKALRMIAK